MQPSMFIRFPDTLVSHEGEMIRPKVSTNFDFEGELAVVIGRGGRHIKPDRAIEPHRRLHLLHRRQRARLPEILGDLGQEFSGHRPAWALDGDHRRDPDPTRLELTTRLNGQEMQRSGTDQT